jgi:hypothetical protein
MVEWGPAASPGEQLNLLLSRESYTDAVIALSPATAVLQDDRPINEFFLLRTPFDQLMAMELGVMAGPSFLVAVTSGQQNRADVRSY